jgi:tetratricopeptide (TPR) repeat protein
MKRIAFTFIIFFFAALFNGNAQNKPENSKIDILLVSGDYNLVIDTCLKILTTDSLNAEIYYKLGLAYQNLLSEDKSFDCFSKAAAISPDNERYRFMLAKNLYSKGKTDQAMPILLLLCSRDSMNWIYSYYLTSIYMQQGRYDESIKVYHRFLKQDTSNYIFLDKLGFASLKKGDLNQAIDFYNKSMAINNRNISALKNLAYLYSSTNRVDTAIQLLTGGIEIDPADIDLYVRRAGIYYLTNNNKKALDDYLRILSSGDSSFLYLKRAGIGFSNNLQPKDAIQYLLKAYRKDSSDYETVSYLGQNYYNLKDSKNSIYYYKRVLKIISPVTRQVVIASVMLAEAQKMAGLYKDAINTYLSSIKLSSDNSLYMIIANLYDEKLKDIPKAIIYYELYLENVKNSKMNFKSDYLDSVKKRLAFLKEKQSQAVKNP